MHFHLSRYRFPRYPYVKEKDQFLIFIISVFVTCSDLSLTHSLTELKTRFLEERISKKKYRSWILIHNFLNNLKCYERFEFW